MNLIIALLEQMNQILEGLLLWRSREEAFDDEVVDDSGRLSSCRAVESKNFEEGGLVVTAGGLKPVDSMEEEGEMIRTG